MPATQPMTELLEATLRELFQSERSATLHPRVEADRLGTTPPGDAMEEIAAHAELHLGKLDDIARARGFSPAEGAKAVGRFFSVTRNRVADLAMTAEQSYRGTLLGVRHGIDLVRLLRELAVRAEDVELRTWSEQWLTRRLELVERAESQLGWFVDNAARAIEPARTTPLATAARSVLKALGRLDTRRRTEQVAG